MPASDVVIVGAGPAGATTALLLARAGFDVQLLDRSVFPRAKPCGDCVSPGANRTLVRLGLWDSIMAAKPALLYGWRLTAGGASFSAGFDPSAAVASRSLAMPRAVLDAIILEAAVRAGVRVRTGVRATDALRDHAGRVIGVATNDGPMRARLTIGADGLRSRIARSLHAQRRPPRLRKVSFTAHVRGVPYGEPLGEMHVRRGACLGIAPVGAGTDPLFNITLVLASKMVRGQGAHDVMRNGLRAFGQRDLSDFIRDDVEILASGPFDWPARQIIFDGAALVGDAAGYFDPFTGQGIYQALTAAELLAEHASSALRRKGVTERSLVPYAQGHRKLVDPARRIQRAIQFVCARPAVAQTVFAGLDRSPIAARSLIAVTGDIRPARDLLAPAVLTRLVAASMASLIL